MKDITVIVPTYNLEKYIGNCLQSIPVGTDRIEVLVILDGSTDRSGYIAKEFARKYPTIIKVIEKENGNYGSCINVGLSLASGKYVKILDADDTFSENAQEYVSFLGNCETDVVISEWVSVNEEGHTLVHSSVNLPSGKDLCIKDLIDRGDFRIRHFYLAYKTQFLRSINYKQTEGISYTDLEWNTIPFAYVQSVSYYPKVLYRYLRGREGQTVGMNYRSNNMWMENKVVLNLVRFFEENRTLIQDANASFVQSVICVYIIWIYKHYLIWSILSVNKLSTLELIQFDQGLKDKSPAFYQAVDNDLYIRKYVRIRYIKEFRKKYKRNGIPFLYLKLCIKIRKLIKGDN